MNLVSLQNSLDNATFAILLPTLLCYWTGVAFPNLKGLPAIGTAGMAIANLCMAALLGARWLEAGYFPISNLYESLFFLAWGLTAIHLLAEKLSGSRLVGAATSPLALGIVAFAAFTLPKEMRQAEPLVPALKSNWLMMHVSVMMVSYAALLVGSLLSVAFLVVTRGQAIELRGSSVGTGSFRQVKLNRASDLTIATAESGGSGGTAVLEQPVLQLAPEQLSLADTLDNVSYRVIGLGFPLLTIGIIAGAVWANEAWGSYWSWDPKETWALITWLVFAAYLHARITRGWQGRRPAILATVGFGVVWVCYLGVNLLGKGLHSYGWFF
ncbi:c-type cytochrome biogenesis protein CcsB [Synechococcus elongatus]|uniref:Cytochrome c biogenesis protein CcsA n=2 Tax=Synechococcus elongatus TaxID=32046 RepID=CCSA_SYNE7|nr:c-type cytochrome biogenesis protein CcsB [Synechococcus elongatus]Q31QX6.1 RecName: Full=Cytochrome c biogenesis protein CcsA [Synechococcus elongatus PCC 7942 = FACHB-805]Q5N3C1.1 RecName: Full=Cytochrome c biogenesis protein CcsA [Synechococcus elongatus PCC 6301]ABB56543.1 ABC-type transport system involved in cytochrome c biogenesis permease component-like [Synechococcus elongatus PCC 7942 = FACHB-805]AJD56415.1 cytochrome C biogenesis protein [Synechococcus elongatus UTEX 2973]MBD2588